MSRPVNKKNMRKNHLLQRRLFCAGLSALAFAGTREPLAAEIPGQTPYDLLKNTGQFGLPEKPVKVHDAHGSMYFLWPPAKARLARLVVFGHAELELPEAYSRLLAHWASHGYLVAAPLHDDSIVRDGLYDLDSEKNTAGIAPAMFFANTEFGEKRAELCSAVLDMIPTLEAAARIEIDDSRPIIAGHGLGAYAAQLILGVDAIRKDGSRVPGKDPRYYAGLLLSPQGRGILGLTETSWQHIDKPLMVSTGNGDSDASLQSPDRKTDPFSLSPPGNRHLAWLGRINKNLWSGETASANPIREAIFGDILAATTGFIEAYGGYDENMLKLIASNYLDQASGGRIAMFYR